MPDIGMFELILIGIILFVVVGPERMPEFLGQIGRWVRHGRGWMSHLGSEISRESSEVIKPLREAGNELRSEMDFIKAKATDAELADTGESAADKTPGKE